MTRKCIIIDDEQHAINTLSDYINQMPDLKLIGTYTDSILALTEIHKYGHLDFIFLDIDMPRLNGLELAISLRSKTNYLIFTSSHDKYALNAFEVQADQYLLKPIALNKFCLTMDKLMIDPRQRQNETEIASIYVRSEKKGKWIPIDLATISLVEAEANYINIHTATEKHTVYLTMKEIEDALKNDLTFIRVHKSYIVSKKHIAGIAGKVITLLDKSTITVGETYKDQFMRYFEAVKVKSNRSQK